MHEYIETGKMRTEENEETENDHHMDKAQPCDQRVREKLRLLQRMGLDLKILVISLITRKRRGGHILANVKGAEVNHLNEVQNI